MKKPIYYKMILEVKNLSVSFGKEKIIDSLSFNVKENEFVSIIGPNGSGKTTLIKALLGLIPYEGKIKWKEGVKINYLPQWFSKENFSLIPMTVEEFFELKRIDKEKMREACQAVGLNFKKIKKINPHKLSAGEFQRLLIAWSFIDDPDVLLLDEPVTGIDVSGEKTIYDLLYKFWKEKKKTIFMVTHDLNVVYYYSTSVLCLHKKCMAFGKPKDLLKESILTEIYGMKIKFHGHRVRK